jgi:hypothetical protein
MTLADWVFFAVVATLATNHVLVRLPGWEGRHVLFWFVQLLNIACASWVLAFGLPGFDGNLTIVNWVVGLIFMVRAVQNNGRWSAARQRSGSDTEEDDARAKIRAALRAGDTGEE